MTNSQENHSDQRPLSEKPLGYLLATGGGILGGPIGLIVSPIVLLILNNAMKPLGEKVPNRFRTWALIGIIGAPLSLGIFGAVVPSNDVARDSKPREEVTSSSPTQKTSQTPSANAKPKAVATPPASPKNTSVSVGDFAISNISIRPFTGDTKNADVAGKLWVVFGDVTNDGNETAVPAYSMSTSLKDSKDRSFKEADMAIAMNAIVDEAFGGKKVLRFTDGVLPGSTRKNVQIGVFDVSPSSQGLRFCAGVMFGRTKCAS